MDFEKLFPGCSVTADAVQWSDGEFSRLVAVKEGSDWVLTEYGASIAKLVDTSATVIQSPKKRSKKVEQPIVDELDLDDL